MNLDSYKYGHPNEYNIKERIGIHQKELDRISLHAKEAVNEGTEVGEKMACLGNLCILL